MCKIYIWICTFDKMTQDKLKTYRVASWNKVYWIKLKWARNTVFLNALLLYVETLVRDLVHLKPGIKICFAILCSGNAVISHPCNVGSISCMWAPNRPCRFFSRYFGFLRPHKRGYQWLQEWFVNVVITYFVIN